MSETQTSAESLLADDLDDETEMRPISDRITVIRPISSGPFIDFR